MSDAAGGASIRPTAPTAAATRSAWTAGPWWLRMRRTRCVRRCGCWALGAEGWNHFLSGKLEIDFGKCWTLSGKVGILIGKFGFVWQSWEFFLGCRDLHMGNLRFTWESWDPNGLNLTSQPILLGFKRSGKYGKLDSSILWTWSSHAQIYIYIYTYTHIYIYIFKRLRATAGQGPMLRWYGSSWEQDLKAMLPHLEAMLVHLGAMLAHLGAMLAHLGAMLARLGA